MLPACFPQLPHRSPTYVYPQCFDVAVDRFHNYIAAILAFSPVKYKIITRTGLRENASTDDDVSIKLECKCGDSQRIWLDVADRDDFERGHLDGFYFYIEPLARVSHFVLMAHGIKEVNLRQLV